MEEVFRFMVISAPDADKLGESLPLDDPANEPGSPSLEALVEAGDTITSLGDSAFGEGLLAFRKLVLTEPPPQNEPSDWIKAIFNLSALEITAHDDWQVETTKLSFGILAGKFLGGTARQNLKLLSDLRLAAWAIERVAQSEKATPNQLRPLIRGILTLPPSIIETVRALSEKGRKRGRSDYQQRKKEALKQAQSLLETKKKLSDSYESLSTVSRTCLSSQPIDQGKTNRASDISRTSGGLIQRTLRFLGFMGPAEIANTTVPTDTTTTTVTGLLLSEDGLNALPDTTKEVLAESGLDPRTTPIEEITEQLFIRQKRLNMQISMTIRPFTATNYNSPIGMRAITMSAPTVKPSGAKMASLYGAMTEAFWWDYPDEWLPDPESEPVGECTPSNLLPSGVGMLLVIRQQLVRYERTEISHVENVLQGETRTRDHDRRIATEEIFVREVETEITEERDLQTTDRFQLASETTKTIQAQMEAKGELSVSGKYGPTVEFEAKASIATSNSTQRSERIAQEFSQEVVENAVNRIAERVREERTRRIVEEVEERNHHGFINVNDGNIIGVYQWLDKIYQAQVYDYGQRTLYDLIVPEPAAFFIAAFQAEHSGIKATLSKPRAFNIPPGSILEDKYDDYVAEYNATDVGPPPELFKTIAHGFNSAREQEWESARIVQSGEIDIPPGYEAIKGWINIRFTGSEEAKTFVDVFLARRKHYFDLSQSSYREFNMPAETGKIPVGLLAFKVGAVTATIEILCRRTSRLMDQWRLDTHERIMVAYHQQLSDYNNQQERLAYDIAQQVSGQSPAANRKIEATELKRAAISILTNGRILLDSIDLDDDNVPFVDIEAARETDPLIRFLEQAFEWENMNYLFYPYFWGRKEPHWKQKVLFEDVDTGFADFIRAGAARVQLAVRPGFQEAVDHFMKTCEPWDGGDLPAITDPLYVPFIEERKRQLGAPGHEVAVGDPWEVRIPTSLIFLREGSDLPKWRKDGDIWVEDDESG